MRRLVLVLTICALALLGASSAGAAAKKPWPTVAEGAAHQSGFVKVEGWLFVKNTATRRTRRAKVYTGVSNPAGTEWLGYRTAPSLRPGKRHRMRFSYPLPQGLAAGEWTINVCTGGKCLHAGSFTKPAPVKRVTSPPTERQPMLPRAERAPIHQPPAAEPISTVPTDPIPYPVAEPFFHAGGGAEYAAFIPRSYDETNQTPTTLFVWLHGCGGDAEGDAWVVDPGAEEGVPQDWMTLSLGGRDGGCWNPLAETEPLVMAAIADFETHFNVDRRRIILGGYSSGGDLAYRTAFKHSSTFAGLLIENSAPFRDTEASEAELLGAATTKFPIVHLAHAQDTTYKLAEVEPEIAAVRAAGFPVDFIVRPGGHSDSHTDPDKLTYLLPHIDDGWLAPAP
jgi:predicted esterase